jgi:hypothetical protein
MAGSSNSPMFTPPMQRFVEQDSQIVQVPLTQTEWGFRQSSQKLDHTNNFRVENIPNKRA